MKEEERRKELAHFLRTRREQCTPESIGIPVGSRRRTPGLRREELAVLAGIGIAWYSKLEQGQNVTVSPQILESLVLALKLNEAERHHLFILARGHVPADPYPLAITIPPSLQSIVDSMSTYPTYISNPRWDIIGWNEALCRVYADFRALSLQERNILRFMFLHPAQRHLVVQWEKEAQGLLALFRSSTERYVGEAWLKALVTDLRQKSAEFNAWWSRHHIQSAHTGQKELNHPHVGRLLLSAHSFQVLDAPQLRMVVYTPVQDTGTAEKLSLLMKPITSTP